MSRSWFVLNREKIYLGTANVNRQWVRNVQKTPQVRLSIGGETFDGAAPFFAERAEHDRAMAAIRRKYWMYRPLITLGQILASIGVMRDKTGSFEVTLAGQQERRERAVRLSCPVRSCAPIAAKMSL